MEESLVGRRSKRSTAGNRMEAALAEMSIDDLMQDVEEDVDFVSKADEEDVFESDFASTDEGEDNDEEVAEKALQEEEKYAKRTARQKAYAVPKPPIRKVTFNSLGNDGKGIVVPKPKQQRRVSLGQVVDAETGKVLETSKRQSKREATRLNTQELQSRLKTAEDRRAAVAKRPRETERRKTQAELIAAALGMEEDNTKSHREYLLTEEERRRKARVTKASTVGPKVRWRSRIEEATVTVYDQALTSRQAQRPTWRSPYTSGAITPVQQQSGVSYPNSYSVPSGQPPVPASCTKFSQPSSIPQYPLTYVATSNTQSPSANVTFTSRQSPPSISTTYYANQYYPYQYYASPAQGQTQHSPYQLYGQYYAYQPPQALHPPLQLHPMLSHKTTEKQVKNYIELLVDEERPHEKPTWRELMDALFGTHADWDKIRVFSGKNRPFARRIQTCPITGLQARYRDPRTGVPYANAGAFRILTRLLEHEYVWSPSGAPGCVGVFIGHEKQRGAAGIPSQWGEAMAGVGDGWRRKRAERRREKAKEKEKEARIGERRSSRIAAEGGESGEKDLMDVDKGANQGDIETQASAHNQMGAETL